MNVQKKLLLLLLLFVFVLKDVRAKDEPYNVLFIAVDDLNDYISLLKNHPGVRTPNLDQFAGTAVTFSNAYCASPVCNPSRIALLTGKSPHNTGLYELTDAFQNSDEAMRSILLPELFKQNGYTTMWSGKIFHTGGSSAQTRPGKERMDAMWDDRRGQDGGYGPMATVNNITDTITRPIWWNYQEWEGPDSDFPDVRNADLTIERLQQDYEKPFFMALGFYRPHDPWTVPKRFFDLHPLEDIQLPEVLENDLDDLPDVGKEWANRPLRLEDLKRIGQWKPSMQAYLAAISFMDYNLGRVLDALDNSPYRDNTIVVLWADNGFHMGEKHHFAKQALWEQSTRVLLMFRIPGITNCRSFRSQPVSLIDIYPTLAELCGLPQPAQELDGESLVPVIENENYKRVQPAMTFYKFGSASIRTGEWRYIRYYDGTEELYHETVDPREENNLAGDPAYHEVMERLADWYPKKVAPTVRQTGKAGSTVINKK